MRANHKSHSSSASSVPRAARTSAALRQGKIEISGPIPMVKNGVSSRPGTDEGPTFAKPDTWPRRSTLPALQSNVAPENQGLDHVFAAENYKRTSTAFTAHEQSLISQSPGITRTRSKGIKATFRRIFGKSKNDRSTPSPSFPDYRSMPDYFTRDLESTSHRSLRKPSLVFDEVVRGGLNSHAPNPSTPGSSLHHNSEVDHFHPISHGSRRRNSLPSVVLSVEEAETLRQNLEDQGTTKEAKVLQRPHKRTGTKSLLDNLKRKSRSAGALRDMAESQNSFQAQERRLSEEIKYWRNSVIDNPAPVFSAYRHVPVEEGIASEQSPAETPGPSIKAASEVIAPPSQGFDFRNFVTGGEDASVEQRITTVEVKLVDLEYAIANMRAGHSVTLGNLVRRPQAPRAATAPNIMPKSSFDSFSTGSSVSDYTDLGRDDYRKSVAGTLRPVTITQARELANGFDKPGFFPGHTDDEFSQLMSMFQQEREARRALESQLQDLQQQMNEIRFPTSTLRGFPSPPATVLYNTPTHANSVNQSSSPVSVVTAASNRYTVLPYRPASPRVSSLAKAPSPRVKETQTGDDEAETDTEDGFLEAFETPNEAATARAYGLAVDSHRSPQLVGVI